MKKIVLGILFVFCVQSIVNAQAALIVLLVGDKVATEKFHLSVDAGLNIASLPGLKNQQATHGLYFGLGTFIKLNEKWALTPEFKPLSPRGANQVVPLRDYATSLSSATYRFELNYIDVPILVQYKLSEKLFASAGPQISFLTSATQIASGNIPAGTTVEIKEKMKSNFSATYFSFPIEAGYHISDARKGKGMDVKIRYAIGVSNMIAASNYGSSNGSTFQVFLSFPFIK
ncbi:MAG: outer membrane beta-barrel protein [Bacteroidetes bacterium]|nr:outer membrane beta-barrel protein [Bacteroidota bacterium]